MQPGVILMLCPRAKDRDGTKLEPPRSNQTPGSNHGSICLVGAFDRILKTLIRWEEGWWQFSSWLGSSAYHWCWGTSAPKRNMQWLCLFPSLSWEVVSSFVPHTHEMQRARSFASHERTCYFSRFFLCNHKTACIFLLWMLIDNLPQQ